MFRHHTHATLKAPARPGLFFELYVATGAGLQGPYTWRRPVARRAGVTPSRAVGLHEHAVLEEKAAMIGTEVFRPTRQESEDASRGLGRVLINRQLVAIASQRPLHPRKQT